MEPFNIKISTPKQINFREFDEHYRYTDIDLEAMFAMSVDIVDFNGEKYREASDVTAEVESDLMGLFQRCMERLPEGESVVKGFETLIPKAMEAVLSDMEITAKTRIFDFKLTEESEKDYREMMRLENSFSEKKRLAPDGVCLEKWPGSWDIITRG